MNGDPDHNKRRTHLRTDIVIMTIAPMRDDNCHRDNSTYGSRGRWARLAKSVAMQGVAAICESHWGDVTMRPEFTLFFPTQFRSVANRVKSLYRMMLHIEFWQNWPPSAEHAPDGLSVVDILYQT